MKTILASTALALLVSGPALAEAHMGGFVNQAAQDDIYGSDLIGMRFYVTESNFDTTAPVTAEARTDWNDVGEVNDILISADGEVRAVILDIGGFLGMGETTIAVDMTQLNFLHDQNDPNDVFIAMKGAQAALENAPRFERAQMNDAAMTNDQTAASSTLDGGTPSTDPAQTSWQRPAIERDGYQPVEIVDLTAENIVGANVYGVNDESIGEVKDLVLTQDGKVQEAILDIGGFLGMGEHRIAVSYDEMQIIRAADGSDLRVYVSATKEQLEQRPEYNG